MLISTLFSLSADLSLVDVRLEQEGLTLVLRSSQTNAACPECAQLSTHVHGHYTRRLADLPCQKRPVRVCLEVRRFACRTRGCPCTTFAERFPTLTRVYARRTLRQAEALMEIAFAQGGKAGAQLAKRLAMPTSRDTLLRLIRRSALPKRKTPRVLGLDDFAWKKGDRYGTLLVDLQAHGPVEVLPDREADTVVGWLRAHRGVKIISRDRAGTYAEAATRGAPRARQVGSSLPCAGQLARHAQRRAGTPPRSVAIAGRSAGSAAHVLPASNRVAGSLNRACGGISAARASGEPARPWGTHCGAAHAYGCPEASAGQLDQSLRPL
jgi:transposase